MKGIIFDIDGTLAQAKPERLVFVEQEPKDWPAFLDPARVATDDPIPHAQRAFPKLLKIFGTSHIFFLTGRNEGLREVTKEWLKTHFGHEVEDRHLIMRPIGNMDKPTEFKENAMKTLAEMFFGSLFNHDATDGSKTLHGWAAFDDDPYMHPVYEKFGIISFLAPHCWPSIFPEFTELPAETNWRR